jgi:hypothetical protein
MAQLTAYAPHFKGPGQPADSIRDVLNVINNSSIANGHSGAFISHHGDKMWV